MYATPIDAENRNIMEIQRQDIYQGRQMAKILKGKLDQTQKSNATWLVKTIKRLIIKPYKAFRLSVFSFKQIQEATRQNNQIVATFNGNLGAAM